MEEFDDQEFRSTLTSPHLFQSLPARPHFLDDGHSKAKALMISSLSSSYDAPWSAPPYAYKLLSADYTLEDLQTGRQADEPVPAPPPELAQSKYISEARMCLVKLRRQVDEVIARSLSPVRILSTSEVLLLACYWRVRFTDACSTKKPHRIRSHTHMCAAML